MKKVLYIYDMIEDKILILQLAVAVIVIFLQVVMRYIFNNSLSWSEEIARYLYIWQGWLGISLVERKRSHIAIDIIKEKLPYIPKIVLNVIVRIICIFTAVFMANIGFKMVLFSAASGASSTALRIPLALIYAAMPVGCTLYSIRVLFNMLIDLNIIKNRAVDKEG